MSLVRQLGAATFVERKQAARKLNEAGLAAKPALLLGIKDEDLEVRLGAQRILVQVLQNDFDAQIDAFLNDTGADATHDLPGWQLFRQQVGGDQNARQLYADMLRSRGRSAGCTGPRRHVRRATLFQPHPVIDFPGNVGQRLIVKPSRKRRWPPCCSSVPNFRKACGPLRTRKLLTAR